MRIREQGQVAGNVRWVWHLPTHLQALGLGLRERPRFYRGRGGGDSEEREEEGEKSWNNDDQRCTKQ